VQQQLSQPGELERFVSPQEAERLRAVFAGLWSLSLTLTPTLTLTLTLTLTPALTLTLALALTRNPNPDQAISADLVGELVYFDGDLVAVNSHTPHAGPRVGGTVIELHGQARPMSM
jgi:hypothetical protein